MSRKRLKRKRRSCPLCKPGKTGHGNRWRPQEEASLKRFEKAVHRRDWGTL
jgi:hypothetical protein